MFSQLRISIFSFFLIFLTLNSGLTNGHKLNSCSIDIHTDLPEPQPLLLVPGTNRSIMPHDSNGVINWQQNQKIEFHCTEGLKDKEDVQSVIASCSNDNLVLVDGKKLKISEILCEKNSKPVSQTVGSCYKNASLIHIGYDLNGKFLKLIELCFDLVQETTYYAYKQLMPAHASYQKNIKRPGWIAGKDYFSNTNINKLYSKENQLEQLTKLLQSPKKAEKIITDTAFLVRGHLVPKVDFIFGVHQRATMHLLNAAPQWNTINSGNWLRIEESLRNLVDDRQIELDVFSGTFGVMHVNGREFYLTKNSQNQDVMRVPKIFYKIVLEKASGKGVALVMANNPYISQNNLKEYVLCKDVSKSISWVTSRIKDDTFAGYFYACKVNEFITVVKHLPKNIKATQLLT